MSVTSPRSSQKKASQEKARPPRSRPRHAMSPSESQLQFKQFYCILKRSGLNVKRLPWLWLCSSMLHDDLKLSSSEDSDAEQESAKRNTSTRYESRRTRKHPKVEVLLKVAENAGVYSPRAVQRSRCLWRVEPEFNPYGLLAVWVVVTT